MTTNKDLLRLATVISLMLWLLLPASQLFGLDTINLAIPTKSFQQVIYPLAQDREATIAAVTKFSGVERKLAVRIYDDLIGTFTRNGVVDEET